MILFGHIAGVPVEETALSFGPVLLAAGGFAALKLRAIFARIRVRVPGDRRRIRSS